MTNSRVSRGRRTQVVAAEYLRPVWPDIESVAASLKGRDLLKTPGFAPEVKARADFNPTDWIKQAKKNAGVDVPFVIMRPNGYGEEKVGQWLTFLYFEDLRYMLLDGLNSQKIIDEKNRIIDIQSQRIESLMGEIDARRIELLKLTEKMNEEGVHWCSE